MGYFFTFEADTQMTGVKDRSAAEHAGNIPSTRRLSGLSQTARRGFFRKDLNLFQKKHDGGPRRDGGCRYGLLLQLDALPPWRNPSSYAVWSGYHLRTDRASGPPVPGGVWSDAALIPKKYCRDRSALAPVSRRKWLRRQPTPPLQRAV